MSREVGMCEAEYRGKSACADGSVGLSSGPLSKVLSVHEELSHRS